MDVLEYLRAGARAGFFCNLKLCGSSAQAVLRRVKRPRGEDVHATRAWLYIVRGGVTAYAV